MEQTYRTLSTPCLGFDFQIKYPSQLSPIFSVHETAIAFIKEGLEQPPLSIMTQSVPKEATLDDFTKTTIAKMKQTGVNVEPKKVRIDGKESYIATFDIQVPPNPYGSEMPMTMPETVRITQMWTKPFPTTVLLMTFFQSTDFSPKSLLETVKIGKTRQIHTLSRRVEAGETSLLCPMSWNLLESNDPSILLSLSYKDVSTSYNAVISRDTTHNDMTLSEYKKMLLNQLEKMISSSSLTSVPSKIGKLRAESITCDIKALGTNEGRDKLSLTFAKSPKDKSFIIFRFEYTSSNDSHFPEDILQCLLRSIIVDEEDSIEKTSPSDRVYENLPWRFGVKFDSQIHTPKASGVSVKFINIRAPKRIPLDPNNPTLSSLELFISPKDISSPDEDVSTEEFVKKTLDTLEENQSQCTRLPDITTIQGNQIALMKSIEENAVIVLGITREKDRWFTFQWAITEGDNFDIFFGHVQEILKNVYFF